MDSEAEAETAGFRDRGGGMRVIAIGESGRETEKSRREREREGFGE